MDRDEKMDIGKSLGKEKKKIKTSTGLIAIFAAVVVFFGGALTYWTYNDPNSYSSSLDATVVSKTNTNTNASETADWKTYTNTKYGFGLTFTDDWKDYTITETLTENPTSTDSLAYLQIDVPTTNNKNVMDIYVYLPASYEACLKAQDPGPGILLGRNDNYVFTYRPANGLQGEEAEIFYHSLIPNLAKTFKTVPIDLTADWKTYINSEYKYSLKTPKDWTISAKGDADVLTFVAPSFDSSGNYSAGERHLQFYVDANNTCYKNQSLSNFFSDCVSAGSGETDVITKISDTTFVGVSAVQFKQVVNPNDNKNIKPSLGYVLIANNKPYVISYNESGTDLVGTDSTSTWQNDTFKQIFATFQFTK